MFGPKALSIDAAGNAWFVTESSNGTQLVGSLMEVSPSGAYLSGMGGYTGGGLSDPTGVAIDQSGNVFVADIGAGYVNGTQNYGELAKFDLHGNFVAAQATGINMSNPYAVAVAADNTVWVGTQLASTQYPGNTSLFHLSSDGTTATSYPAGTGVKALAISPAAIWSGFTDQSGYPSGYHCCIGRVDATTLAPQSFSTVYSNWVPQGMAVDRTGQIWTAMQYQSQTPYYGLIEMSNAGAFVSPQIGYTGGGGGVVVGITFDGLNRAWAGRWMNNSQASYGSLLELNDSGTFLSPGAGYTGTGSIPLFPTSVAVDGSGNVWMTGEGSIAGASTFVPGALIEMVGLGAPVVTPMSVAVKNATVAQRP